MGCTGQTGVNNKDSPRGSLGYIYSSSAVAVTERTGVAAEQSPLLARSPVSQR